MKTFFRTYAAILALSLTTSALADETQTLYLSGKGKDDPVKWDFMCSAGQNSGKWSTIGVPSNWELQGFGIYTYGRGNPWPKVTGQYKRTFTVPDTWNGKQISIVFEGVMTDTQVKVNGQSAGPLHAGGYYRFKHDITKLLKPGENLLEVTVDDESATPSVNNAERRGDYWNYAGIYRPVYLEAVPQNAIERVAISAGADGKLTAEVKLAFLTKPDPQLTLSTRVLDAAGIPINGSGRSLLDGANGHIEMNFTNPKLWTAETPNLYTLEVRLGPPSARETPPGGGDTNDHTVHQKFGFRTIEVRQGEGVFLNGSRIMFKGADRHSYWPDSGRCLSEKVSRDDIALMKDMNMNAVRCSHYPPDRHFLDACDELGMYVLDELAGWHQAYDTATGTRLVQEMVTRDVNHPSILFWDNGNEGGWNNALDAEFAKYDPQKRAVLHPQVANLRGIDNSHYPQYNAVVTKSAANTPVFYTEFLHGLYDGGHGAGLEDYWKAIQAGKATAGGFLWALNDEDLVRTDKGNILDSAGNQAPDGILGPYREKEGSFYTIKQIWSPIVMTGGVLTTAAGNTARNSMEIENRFDFIDAKDCSFTWEIRKMHTPKDATAGSDPVSSGNATVVGSIAPHSKGKLTWDSPVSLFTDSVTYVHAFGPDKREVMTFSLPNMTGMDAKALAKVAATGTVKADDAPENLTATAGDLSLQFSKKTGLLAAASRNGKTFSFLNGPRLVASGPTPAAPARGAQPTPATPAPASNLMSLTQKPDGNDLVISATFAPAGDPPAADGQGLKSIIYRVRPNGWVTIDYAYNLTGPHEYFGVGFDYPEANVKSMSYLGDGPSTVYQNRLAGGTLDVWDKKYNDTMVGDPDDLKPGEHFDYPVFKGYYNHVRWLQLQTSEGPITALLNSDDLFVQVLTPKVPPVAIQGQTGVPVPNAGISFLHAISAIGSKFNGPKTTGPMGQPAVAKGDYIGSISLYFGALP